MKKRNFLKSLHAGSLHLLCVLLLLSSSGVVHMLLLLSTDHSGADTRATVVNSVTWKMPAFLHALLPQLN